MTVELTSREVFLLLQDNVRQLEANENSIKPECHKEITTKMRELLDLFDEAEHREAVKYTEWRQKITSVL